MVNVKQGDVVFFRKVKKSSKPKSPEIGFKGNGFGVFLGHVPLFAPDPPGFLIFRMLGQTGFISFDDVKEFIGDEEKFQAIVDKYTDKYWGQKTEEIQKEATARAAAHDLREAQKAEETNGEAPQLVSVPTLIDINGRPLGKDEQ